MANFSVSFDASSLFKGLDKLDKQVDVWALDALGVMADTLLLLSQREVPHLKGTLQGSGATRKNGKSYEVFYNMPYAEYQHEGIRSDGTHAVKNYTGGRKKKYLEDPLKMNMSKWQNIFKTEIAAKLSGKL